MSPLCAVELPQQVAGGSVCLPVTSRHCTGAGKVVKGNVWGRLGEDQSAEEAKLRVDLGDDSIHLDLIPRSQPGP